ncbi:MAG TPA: AsmA family protein [Anaerohalosphaeraceae bacterium]|nr:AsmA family protein [Phycisphaerae bacterium]HOK94676.1 AsmA family protein [Anaerohalosphaeraceae bacterium]HOL30612.1 AsmA family protein [Anaerohalosphaeraceae bacterium]HOM75277.1 AsmA family protein [Anaerohalosphaeraceae bacterium]HPC63123.1 AsmA family protein [Anaerohalosphaeraceae bacterium]
MNKQQKILTGIVFILFVLIVAAGILIKIYGNEALRIGIEKASQSALQVKTRLAGLQLSLLRGTLDLHNLEIDNPEGFEHPTFLKLGHGHTALNIRSLLDETIVIDRIQLENIEIVLEQKGLTSNLKEILNNLPKSEGQEPKAEEKKSKNIQITQLIIKDVKVKANLVPVEGLARASTVSIPLKEIRMENIGTAEKIDAVQLTAMIIRAIAEGIVEQGKGILPLDMINSFTEELSKQGEALLRTGQQLLEEAGKTGKELLDVPQDIGKKAAEGLKGLLPGKKEE